VVAGAQQSLKGSGLRVWVSLVAVGLAPGWGLAPTGHGDPRGHGSTSITEGRVSPRGVGLVAGRQPGSGSAIQVVRGSSEAQEAGILP
jgi:hypothetical protein